MFKKEMKVGLLNSFKINCKNNFDTIFNNNLWKREDNLRRNRPQIYLKKTLPYTHLCTDLQAFIDKQPKKQFPVSFLKIPQQL